MMREIKCEECGEVMGSINKPVISQADIDLYRAMVTCSLGHTTATLAEETPAE